jgi:uncharacterized protein
MSSVGTPTIRRYLTASAFLEAATPFLVAREADHNLIFGIASSVLREAEIAGSVTPAPYLATAELDGRVVGAAIMTPPRHVVLSLLDQPGSIDAFVEDLGRFDPPTPGVSGRPDLARAFARAWCAPRDLIARRSFAERIYRLERVIPPTGIPGGTRIATQVDRELLLEWSRGFLEDGLERVDETEVRQLVDRALDQGQRTFYLWEVDGRPVSMAALGGPTPNGLRIGPVYTPRDERGHGYASAVTAAASQAALDAGRRFVFLFTDLANPTSNKIYQAIGYEPVSDVDVVRFEGG